MVKLALNGQILLVGKASDVFAELERIAAFSQYDIGWCHPLYPLQFSNN